MTPLAIPTRVHQTYVINIPPLTDLNELLGNYHNLFVARGVTSCIPFRSNGNFTHPVPASNQMLLQGFMDTNALLGGLFHSYEAISVDDVITAHNGNHATFFFSMQEKMDYVIHVDV